VLELRHRALGDVEPPGELGLADRFGVTELVPAALLQRRDASLSESIGGAGPGEHLVGEFGELAVSTHSISPSVRNSSRYTS
jgi:hypothetical protein